MKPAWTTDWRQIWTGATLETSRTFMIARKSCHLIKLEVLRVQPHTTPMPFPTVLRAAGICGHSQLCPES